MEVEGEEGTDTCVRTPTNVVFEHSWERNLKNSMLCQICGRPESACRHLVEPVYSDTKSLQICELCLQYNFHCECRLKWIRQKYAGIVGWIIDKVRPVDVCVRMNSIR